VTELDEIVSRVRAGQRFILSSHARPDGDAVGSALAAAFALRKLGKDATVVMDSVPPASLQAFPGVSEIIATTSVTETYDAALIMECSTLDRTGVAGLDRSPVVNIDHHPGNAQYGVVNWVDESAAACGELVAGLVDALGVPLDPAIATHLYLTILTDTGSFHFSHLTAHTFELARRMVEAGADPVWIARTHYDSNNLGRVRLFGSVLSGMQLGPDGRVAVLAVTQRMAEEAGGTYDDTEGLINFPLSVKEIQAVAFLKEIGPGDWRISLRSKGKVNVGVIAQVFGGGGHANASGCGATGDLATLTADFMQRLTYAVSLVDTPATPFPA
jgi:bifunctional oligoribonuclease and PAP phosphatase NrnA